MICCEFIAKTMITTIYDLNDWCANRFKDKLGKIDNSQKIIKMPISAHTKLGHMLPDDFMKELKKSGCLQEQPFNQKVLNILDIKTRKIEAHQKPEKTSEWLKRGIEELWNEITATEKIKSHETLEPGTVKLRSHTQKEICKKKIQEFLNNYATKTGAEYKKDDPEINRKIDHYLEKKAMLEKHNSTPQTRFGLFIEMLKSIFVHIDKKASKELDDIVRNIGVVKSDKNLHPVAEEQLKL
ncbi:hypothetical protein GAMM_170063 [Gammaproteobacteria bacterium]